MFYSNNNFNRKPPEPLTTFHPQYSDIESEKDALSIIKSNAYYIFVYSFLLLIIGIFASFINAPEFEHYKYFFFTLSPIFLILGLCVIKYKSRTAALIIFGFFIFQAIERLFMWFAGVSGGAGGSAIIVLSIMLMASFRLIKATYYYQGIKRVKVE